MSTLDTIVHLHDTLPVTIKWPLDFAVNVIFIRGILANEILREIRQRGWMKFSIIHNTKNLIEDIMKRIKEWTVIARKVAISEHYRHGHKNDLSVGCSQGRCGIFSHA